MDAPEFAIPKDAHDFKSEVVGYEKPSEPQWVQDIVRCHMPPILKYTCQKCGYSFGGRNGIYSLMLMSGALSKCPDPDRKGSMEGLPVIDDQPATDP